MSLKLKALFIMVGGICIAVAGVFLAQYIAVTFSTETIKTGIATLITGALLYTVYGLILSRLEYEQKVDEISKNIKEITNK